MGNEVSRRQFLGATAGGIVMASQLNNMCFAAGDGDDWPKMPPVKIYKIFIGRAGDIYMSRPSAEIGQLNEYCAGIEKKLGDVQFIGGETIPPEDAAAVVAKMAEADGIIMFHLSGHGGDQPSQSMDLIIDTDKPTVVFSPPFSGHGWMYFPKWAKAGKKVVALPTSDWSELERVAKLLRVPSRMRQTKMLCIRGPMGTAETHDFAKIKERLGVEVIPVTVEQTLEAHKAVDIKEAEKEAEEYWIGKAQKIVEPTRDEIVNSARLYLAIKKMMIEQGAQAVTSSNCMGEPAKGCFTFSKLCDLGYVGACEGDMDSTLTMLMFNYAFNVPGFITDPVFDVARNALIHFHCTSATKMDGPGGERLPFTIRTQTDSDKGVALAVDNRIGQPVTCAKFVHLDNMLISTGKIIEVTHSELACRTQFVTEVADARKMFMNWGGGVLQGDVMTMLHRVVFYGDHMQSIRDLGTLMGFNVVEEA